MILNSRYLWLILIATVVSSVWAASACSAPAKNGNVVKPVAAEPTADALLALERQANEAYIKGDGKFFRKAAQRPVSHAKGRLARQKD